MWTQTQGALESYTKGTKGAKVKSSQNSKWPHLTLSIAIRVKVIKPKVKPVTKLPEASLKVGMVQKCDQVEGKLKRIPYKIMIIHMQVMSVE